MTFYLKYRPQKLAELDLKAARDKLTQILSAKEIPHAFLFSGPKGTGKTSSARIVAKSVNCLNRATKKRSAEPCNKCENCQLITSGRSLDLIEIDAASNRGIDDIRELRDKIKLAPSRLKFKVYIIDEVHMLTNEAFNALLKTLEEPPEHVKFVLCTTRVDKLPETIISRCFEVQFTRAKTEEMITALKRVVQAEKLKIKDKDLEKIASQASGSFRDAVKILEQLAATGRQISSDQVTKGVEQGVDLDQLDEWLELIYQGQTQPALQWLEQALSQGAEAKTLVVKALERLRQILLVKLGVEAGEIGKDKWQDLNKLMDLIDRLMTAAERGKMAVVESLPLELAVVASGSDQPVTELPPTTKLGKLTLGTIRDQWEHVLEAVRPHNHSLEALLRATKPVGFEGKYLILEVFYRFHKERLELDRYRRLVEEAASRVFKQNLLIKYYLGNKDKSKPNEISLAEVEDEDIIKTAEEVFGVEVKGGD